MMPRRSALRIAMGKRMNAARSRIDAIINETSLLLAKPFEAVLDRRPKTLVAAVDSFETEVELACHLVSNNGKPWPPSIEASGGLVSSRTKL